MLTCHRNAPEEKPEATIGKWPVWNSLFGPVSRPRLGDAIGMSASLSVPHPSAWYSLFGRSTDAAMDLYYTGVSHVRQRNYLTVFLLLHSAHLLHLII